MAEKATPTTRRAKLAIWSIRATTIGRLGHVHKREVLSENPLVIFPGNLQGRHIIETGPKGCTLVTVDDKHKASAEAVDLSVLRWEHCFVDAGDAASEDDVLKEVGVALGQLLTMIETIPLAVRIEIVGAGAADGILRSHGEHFVNQVRAIATDMSRERIWVEKVKIKTTPERSATVDGSSPGINIFEVGNQPGDGPIGELLQLIGEYKEDSVLCASLREQLVELERKLPDEVKKSLNWSDDNFLQDVLDDVQDILLDQLVKQ